MAYSRMSSSFSPTGRAIGECCRSEPPGPPGIGGVRVYTIGFGTASPAVLRCTPEQLGGDELANRIGRGGFGSFGRGFGRGNFLRLDEQTLTNVAEITDAEYYLAESADELLEVFSTIPLQIEKKKVRMEVSAVLTAISALLALSAVALSLRWSPLP